MNKLKQKAKFSKNPHENLRIKKYLALKESEIRRNLQVKY